MSELKPCPFCGADERRIEQAMIHAGDMVVWSVECMDCGAERASDTSQAEADELWNTRAATPVQNRGEGEALAFVKAYVAAWEAGTGTVYLIDQAREIIRNMEARNG